MNQEQPSNLPLSCLSPYHTLSTKNHSRSLNWLSEVYLQIGLHSFLQRLEHQLNQVITVDQTMRWLVSLHALIQRQQHDYQLISAISSTMINMEQSRIQSKHDKYMLKHLVQPYRMYLVKFIQLKTCEHTQHQYYLVFNLLTFVQHHFKKTVRQFTRFLTQHQPYNAQYQNLIKQDVLDLIRIVDNHDMWAQKKPHESKVSFIQIEQIKEQLQGIFGKQIKGEIKPEKKENSTRGSADSPISSFSSEICPQIRPFPSLV